MQTQLQRWKRQREEGAEAAAAPPVLREGLRVKLASIKPERARAAMAALTFQPRSTFDSAEPPAKVLCYSVEEDALLLPRCYTGALSGGGVVDGLSSGEDATQLRFSGELNELQRTAADLTVAQLRSSPHAAVLTLPCGFGKTVVALSVAAALGRKTLVVVHKDSLVQQWLDRVRQFLPAARTGVIRQRRADYEDVDVCLAMLQTLCAREMPPGCLASFGTVVLDEAHHLGAPYFSKLFFRLPCRHVLGLTATPTRKDGCSAILHLFMGPFSFQLKARSQEGVVVRRVRWPSAIGQRGDLSPPEMQRLKGRLVKDERRNAFLAGACRRAVEAGRCVMCLSERLEHLRELRRLFEAVCPGASCAFYVGGAGKANLAERALAEGEARAIFATFAMAQEAVDIPRLDTLILATPIADATQAVGRILRPCAAKQLPVVVDVLDDGCANFARLASIRQAMYLRSSFAVEDLSGGGGGECEEGLFELPPPTTEAAAVGSADDD
jgi:superfamily II DNA or RNA helicase